MSRLDELMPTWDHHEIHRRWLPAARESVWDALWHLRVRELSVTGALTRLRGGPSAWRRNPAAEHADMRVMDAMAPKLLIAERPEEMVLTDVARYTAMRPARPERAGEWTPEDFAAYAEPGWSKVCMNFVLIAKDRGTELSTETRVVSTDAATRRSFAAYWLAVRAGSGMIRRDIIGAIAKAARTPPVE